MKLILRTGLIASALSLASLAACGGSDDPAPASAAPAAGSGGSSTAGTGGTSTTAGAGGTATTAGTGGTSTAGTGGTSTTAGTGGTSTAGTGGTSAAGTGGTSTAGTGGTSAAGTGGSTTGNKLIKAADGGTVTADGLTVEIPPGALMVDTEITVTVSDGASSPAPTTLVSKVYDLGPNGTMFTKPVKMTLDFDAAKLGTKIATVSYVDMGKWIPLSNSTVTGTKVAATTLHFTPFGVVGAEAAACIAMAKADCSACCKATFPSGNAKILPAVLQKCACDAGSLCNAQCASNACMGMAVTPDCQTCLSQTGPAKTACLEMGLIACASAEPDCSAFITCGTMCK